MFARYYTSVAELKSVMGTTNAEAAATQRLRRLIREASRHLEEYTHRRFDWRVETINHTARHLSDKGDLINSTRLALRQDCQSVTAVTNLGTVVTLGDLTLSGGFHAAYKWMLDWTSDWQTGAVNGNDIAVTGVWGYGGAMLKTVYTLAADATNSALTLNLTGIAGLEYGMLIRIDDEYLIIDDEASPLVASAVHVERGANGTTAAAHTSGTPVYVFVADYIVQRVTKRLGRWMSALDDNPLYSSAVMGDVEIPFNPSAWPHDLLKDVALLEKKPSYIGTPR